MSQEIIKLMLQGIEETLFMVSVSTIIAAIIGIPLGITLVITGKGHILENRVMNQILGTIVNIIRSVPFIILMVAIIPLTRLIAGTSIGTTAACVPLTIVAIPFLSRLVETSIRDVDFGLVEAAESMGASPFQIIHKVLIPEALPTIINNITVLIVNLIGASAMAGAIGGGGLGDIAIRYGYQRFRADVMLATIIILIVGVNLIQAIGDFAARKKNKK
ncbi:methionine ABC transporter permease [Megasphaera cerevisiae DSM 20462]|jgi:D-methionine transport system permease protein|uniref:Methionine ABC transporter permease n=1 Tax=Megasphaera cerevisiae DSM 20462 TaxID=1122219 RepID=A0A0J6WV13_9FIRM|nr:methionine ABC transporter permease [Megasphaera cerevisiae]KMO87390.1 methionine ABC transporter permease [Megasphaera cerevisiae DSM 20462]MCI1749881.1 ABC transporter permease [Megasphaera cerevisiae]OKY54811.1 methionine ABC transporter permease [Megasphaera cerevisiae]SJZ38614.1 D-methionine transport system permease protein [Megasphaera cerevisiae DSM 20462]